MQKNEFKIYDHCCFFHIGEWYKHPLKGEKQQLTEVLPYFGSIRFAFSDGTSTIPGDFMFYERLNTGNQVYEDQESDQQLTLF